METVGRLANGGEQGPAGPEEERPREVTMTVYGIGSRFEIF